MEVPECIICFEKFDLLEKTPMILKNCGHSFCRECSQILFTRARNSHQRHLDCAICKKRQDLSSFFSNSFEETFTKNFVMVDALTENPQISECAHFEPKYICLANDCSKSAKCCWKCLASMHHNCDENWIEKTAKVKIEADWQQDQLTLKVFNAQKTKLEIRRKMDHFCLMLESIADYFQNSLQQQMESARRICQTGDFPSNTKRDFEITRICKASYKLTLKDEKIEEWEEASRKISKSLEKDVFELWEKSLTDLILKNTKSFEKIDPFESRKNESTLKMMNEWSRPLLSNLQLANFTIHFPFDFGSFLTEANKHMTSQVYSFSSSLSSVFDQTELKQVEIIVSEVLNSREKSVANFEDEIKKKCEDFFAKRFFVSLKFGQFLNFRDGKRGFRGQFTNSDFFISVHEI